jgi:hypothetical protein
MVACRLFRINVAINRKDDLWPPENENVTPIREAVPLSERGKQGIASNLAD